MKILDVSKIYNDKQSERIVLSNISLDLPDKGIISIAGKSGSGKSTLLRILGGLDKPSTGSVMVGDFDLATASLDLLDMYRNTYCGFVFQDYNLMNELTVYENIEIVLDMQRRNNSKFVNTCLSDVGLSGYESKRVFECSGGERQRIAIARAMIKEPKVLLCDEPTGALDEQTGELILNILKKISETTLVVIVTHDEKLVSKYSNRIIRLSDGRIKEDTQSNFISTEVEYCATGSNLSYKYAKKIGFSNIQHHPIRLALTLIITVLALTLFMLSFNFSTINHQSVVKKVLINEGVDVLALRKEYHYQSKDKTFQDYLYEDYFDITGLSIQDYEFLLSNNLTKMGIYYTCPTSTANHVANSLYDIAWLNDQISKGSISDSISSCSGYAYMNEEDFNSQNKVTGLYPQSKDEVAIPLQYANAFCHAGYYSNGVKINISSPYDMLGKVILSNELGGEGVARKITGIYEPIELDTSYESESVVFSPSLSLYVSKTSIADLRLFGGTNTSILAFAQTDDEISNLVSFITKYKDTQLKDGYYSFSIMNTEYTDTISSIKACLILRGLMNMIGVVFLGIAIAFLSMSINKYISDQIRQIGILKSLGVSRKGIYKIYLGLITLIDVLALAFTIPMTYLGTIGINAYLQSYSAIPLSIVTYSPLFILVGVVMLALISGISMLLPIRRLNRLTPIQIINEGRKK